MMEFRCSFLFIQICKKFERLWKEFRNVVVVQRRLSPNQSLSVRAKTFFRVCDVINHNTVGQGRCN